MSDLEFVCCIIGDILPNVKFTEQLKNYCRITVIKRGGGGGARGGGGEKKAVLKKSKKKEKFKNQKYLFCSPSFNGFTFAFVQKFKVFVRK